MGRPPTCQRCGGIMRKAKAKRNDAAGCIPVLLIFIVGVVFFILIPICGWMVGSVLCSLAILVAFRRDKVWRCTECQAIVPRRRDPAAGSEHSP